MLANDPIAVAIPDCPICRGWLPFIMVEPLRCPGLGIDKHGRYIIGQGKNTRLWDDVVREAREKSDAKMRAYFAEHSKHMKEHGLIAQDLEMD
jgi:hypothetical protein